MRQKYTAEEWAALGEALDAYTDPSHPEYDPVFDAAIRKRQPKWFADEPAPLLDGGHRRIRFH